MRYWAPVLDRWAGEPSPYPRVGANKGGTKHPIHYDPRDESRLWFREPERREWHALERVGRTTDVPFSDAMAAWARELAVAEGLNPRNPDLISRRLNQVLERQANREPLDATEKKLFERAQSRATLQTSGEAGVLGRRRSGESQVYDHGDAFLGDLMPTPLPADDEPDVADDDWDDDVEPMERL